MANGVRIVRRKATPGPGMSEADRDASATAILEHEIRFATALGARVVEKPAVSLWMVLIPILFLHYMHRHQQFKAGVAGFVVEYLKPRRRALRQAQGAAEPAIAAGDTASARRLGRAESAQVAVLADHYRRLLQAGGRSYSEMLRAAYPTRAGYEAFLYELGETDGEINAAVMAAANGDPATAEIVGRLDAALRAMHRDELGLFYGAPASVSAAGRRPRGAGPG